jgi:hypothetical protein
VFVSENARDLQRFSNEFPVTARVDQTPEIFVRNPAQIGQDAGPLLPGFAMLDKKLRILFPAD